MDTSRLQAEIQKALQICVNEEKDYSMVLGNLESRHRDTIKAINDREKEIRDMVSKYARSLRDQVEREKTSSQEHMANRRGEMGKYTVELKDVEKTLDKGSKESKAEISSKALAVVKKVKESDRSLSQAIFSPGDLTHQNIVNLFGFVRATTMSKSGIKLISSYNSNLNFVYRLCLLGEKSIWISNFKTKTLSQIHFDSSDNLQTVHEISSNIFDMCSSPNNDIFLAMRDTSEVKMLMKSGKTKPVFKVKGLIPRGLHISKDNRILLGVTEVIDEGSDLYTVDDVSCRQIIVYGMDGQQKQAFGHGALTLPTRITTTNNKDVAVIDALSDNSGRIIGLDPNGLKWTYGEHLLNAKPHPFDPRDIRTSLKDQLIVADCNNHAIHVLSGEGTPLSVTNMKEQGLIFPYSLDVDKSDKIWVGCDTYKGRSDAQIHVIEIL